MSKKIKHYSVDEILTYLDCSLCHHIKYHLKMVPPASALSSQKNLYLKESIYESIAFYYREHQNKKMIHLKDLYNKFYRAWIHKNDIEDEISILDRPLEEAGYHTRQAEDNYVQRAYRMLKNFYNYNNNIKQSVLTFNEVYELNVGDSIIDGSIPLIREVQEGRKRSIHLVNFTTTNRKIALQDTKNNFTYMLNAFAFQQMLKIHPDKIVIYNLAKDTETELVYSRNDYQRLFNIIQSFLQIVGKVKPYPTTSVHTYSTLYKDYCDSYNYDINPL